MNYPLRIATIFLRTIDRFPIEYASIGSGLIHNTFLVKDAKSEHYILQQINTDVFKDPKILAHNLNILDQAFAHNHVEVNTPKYLRVKDTFIIYEKGAYWRMYYYMDGVVFNTSGNTFIAGIAAKALGSFHSYGKDIALKSFQESIPDFTNFEDRIIQLNEAAKIGIPLRMNSSKDFYFELVKHLHLIEEYIKIEKNVPSRLIHGDPKISNFIFTKNEKRVQSIIDLDTVGKGSVLYDFGDMVRSFANRCNENEKIKENLLDQEVLVALHKGYLSSSNSFLTKLELNSLELASRVVCLVQAIRFYTDYLLGDNYYKVKSESDNLIRAKNQFQLFKELLKVELTS